MISDEQLGPFDRILSRLTIVNWPQDPPDDLHDAVLRLATFELANDAPTTLPGVGGTEVLAWRGYLTGGIGAMYEHLVELIDEHELTALLADPRLEVHIAAGSSKVIILGALRHAVVLERDEFAARLRAATGANDLAQSIVIDAMNEGATEVLGRAAERDAVQPAEIGAPPPDTLGVLPPGEVYFDVLEEATVAVAEHYDPEHNLIEASITCETFGGWRTEFLPPGMGDDLPGERHEQTLTWRVAQWRWTEADHDHSDEFDDEDDSQAGRWSLLARAEIDVDQITQWLPEELVPLLERLTEHGAEILEYTDASSVPDAARRRQQLVDGLVRLRAQQSHDNADTGGI